MLEDAAAIRKVVIACGYVDLRKGIDGLSMIIGDRYRQNPFEKGTLFLFCGRRSDRIKGLEQVRIVKFILQPIVENIFEHGFTMDENDNKIWIKAFKCENDIVILVKDNGCGIDSEKREELNRILCERTRRISYIDEEEKSIGINNVNTRIKNYYGEKYGVKVNKADKGTEIQLLLGIENLEEENKDK